MEKGLDILAFLEKAGTVPVVDVRTPAEYARGHIPSSHNIPLFSDEERKNVGITYKQSGQGEAIVLGLEYAGPKMKKMALEAAGIAPGKQVLVHCWRGGMRSASMAWLFRTVGLESLVLEGGYKSFRRHALSFLENDFPFVVIGGLTGSGKTDVLRALEKSGEQVLDLEKLASHKGSAFGGLGEMAQCTNEQFENDVFWNLKGVDKDRIIWTEDESRTIGRITLPAGIYQSIRSSPLICLDVTIQSRIERLVRNYAKFPKESLGEAVQKIRPRLGDRIARLAMEGIREGDYRRTAELVLYYYDKTYQYGLGKRDPGRIFSLPFGDVTEAEVMAEQILVFVKKNRITDKIL
jgi:tRNA 2-selenouridine synthase